MPILEEFAAILLAYDDTNSDEKILISHIDRCRHYIDVYRNHEHNVPCVHCGRCIVDSKLKYAQQIVDMLKEIPW